MHIILVFVTYESSVGAGLIRPAIYRMLSSHPGVMLFYFVSIGNLPTQRKRCPGVCRTTAQAILYGRPALSVEELLALPLAYEGNLPA